jgi:hypothetical protein
MTVSERNSEEHPKTDLVNGLPAPVLVSIRSVKASISATVLADDMDKSLLFVERGCALPSKVFNKVGWCNRTIHV